MGLDFDLRQIALEPLTPKAVWGMHINIFPVIPFTFMEAFCLKEFLNPRNDWEIEIKLN